MRFLIIFMLIFIFASPLKSNAVTNVKDLLVSSSNKSKEAEDALKKSKSSIEEAQGALSHPNARDTSYDLSKNSNFIDGFKGNTDKSLNTIMGKGDEKIYALDGNSSVKGKLYCAGQDEIADIQYSKDINGLINMNINITKQGTLLVSAIKGICSDSFMICDKKINQNLCNGFKDSIAGLNKEEIANHPCQNNYECMNWNFNNNGKNIYLDPNGSISCPVSSNTEILTKQISAVLSSAYFSAISDIKESADKNNVKLYSLDSSQCGEGGDMDNLGIGGLNLDELQKIYESGNYPKAENQLSKESGNKNSIASMLLKSNDTLPDISNKTDTLDSMFGEMEGEFSNKNFADTFINDQNSCYIQTCTIEKSFNKNNVNYDGSTNASLGNQISITTEIRECINNSNKFTCPIEAGETITTDCSCSNSDELITNLGNVLKGTTLINRITKNIDELCNQNSE